MVQTRASSRAASESLSTPVRSIEAEAPASLPARARVGTPTRAPRGVKSEPVSPESVRRGRRSGLRTATAAGDEGADGTDEEGEEGGDGEKDDEQVEGQGDGEGQASEGQASEDEFKHDEAPKRRRRSRPTPRSPRTGRETPSGGGKSARARARTKDRLRALRAAAGVPLSTVSAPERSELAKALEDVLRSTKVGESACASRAARAVAAQRSGDEEAWTAVWPAARAVVLEMVREGRAVVVRGDQTAEGVGQLRIARGERF